MSWDKFDAATLKGNEVFWFAFEMVFQNGWKDIKTQSLFFFSVSKIFQVIRSVTKITTLNTKNIYKARTNLKWKMRQLYIRCRQMCPGISKNSISGKNNCYKLIENNNFWLILKIHFNHRIFISFIWGWSKLLNYHNFTIFLNPGKLATLVMTKYQAYCLRNPEEIWWPFMNVFFKDHFYSFVTYLAVQLLTWCPQFLQLV